MLHESTLSDDYGIDNVLIMIDSQGHLATSNKSKMSEAINNHKRWIDFAARIGCKTMRVNLNGEDDLEKWAEWYKNDGPFPNNEISLFVQTGETSAFGIATYPSEEAREEGGKIRDELVHSSKMSYKVKDVVPLGGPVLVEFIDGILSPKHNPK